MSKHITFTTTSPKKAITREQLQDDIERFLSKGGEIREIPVGVGNSYNPGGKKKTQAEVRKEAGKFQVTP